MFLLSELIFARLNILYMEFTFGLNDTHSRKTSCWSGLLLEKIFNTLLKESDKMFSFDSTVTHSSEIPKSCLLRSKFFLHSFHNFYFCWGEGGGGGIELWMCPLEILGHDY